MIRPRLDPATGKPEAAWCRNHANRQIGRVKHIFKWAVTKELVKVDVHATLLLLPGLRAGKSVARERKPVGPVDEARVVAILPYLSAQVAAMVQLHVLCAMRSTEICIMRPCDVDRNGTPWRYTPMFHKTQEHGIEKSIAIGQRARTILEPFLNRPATEFCFSPAEAEAARRALLHEKRKTPASCGNVPGSNRKGKPSRVPGNRYDRRGYYNAIKHACERAFNMPAEFRSSPADYPCARDTPAEIKKKAERRLQKSAQRSKWHAENGWFPHQARHTGATNVRRAGNLDNAMVILGHTNSQMTKGYALADVLAAHQVIERIG